jgi:Right handed beta helix region
MRAERKWSVAILILLASLCLCLPMRAANVSVGCPGGSGGTYPSINAALSAVGQIGPHTITVTGTCAESVSLFNARSILITAPTPGGATIIGLQDSDTFDIGLSQDITLQNMEIRGNPASSIGYGVSIFTNSLVNIVACNIHDSPDGGVSADSGSAVALNNTTLQNSSNGDGLDLTNSSSADMVFTTIQNNAGVGISLFDHSSIVIRRQNTIQNNAGGFGIYALDSSKVQIQTAVPALFTTIQGHGQNGIAVGDQTMLRMQGGPHAIQGNGSACPSDPTCGGIYAIRNSTLRLTSGNISGNQGSGITVEQLVDFGLSNTTISNNTAGGVLIRRISVGDFLSGNTVTGNGRASVTCDTTSEVVGDLSTFSNVACSQVERPLGPPRPGNTKHPIP